MTYRIRYALRLWAKGMPLLQALRYPTGERGDPIEDADEEIYLMQHDT